VSVGERKIESVQSDRLDGSKADLLVAFDRLSRAFSRAAFRARTGGAQLCMSEAARFTALPVQNQQTARRMILNSFGQYGHAAA
jgi:hypothetical protein